MQEREGTDLPDASSRCDNRHMVWAEFEEKELEGPINAQLSMGGPLWSPGQVLEQIVGFDVAIMVDDISFWASVGFGAAPAGLPVLPSWWSSWPSVILRPLFRFRTPPKFRLNLFLQYKRPERLTRGQEWPDWKKPYFRFDLTPHQQSALEACAKSLGTGGLAAYGSPAFHRRTELFTHVEKRTLVENTHFAPALQLASHARYTYVTARGAGKAHSEPVDVQPIVFSDEHESPGGPPTTPPDNGGAGDGPYPDAVLREAKKAARAAVAASPLLVGSAEGFERSIARAQEVLEFLRPGLQERGLNAAENYLVASIFSRMSGIHWAVLT